jgi:hypothetical protein
MINLSRVSGQGEMINRIEKNILSSADYVERGQEHVKIALENQKKARKVSLAPSPGLGHSRVTVRDPSSPTEKSHDCHLCLCHCSHLGCHHWHHHNRWIMSHVLGEKWRACPIPGSSLPASCQTHFFLLPLQALGETETQLLWRWGRPPTEPVRTLDLVQRACGSSWVGSCSFMESSPGVLHNACETVFNVLFVWDTWFCKKFKKKKKKKKERKKRIRRSLEPAVQCVLERLAQASSIHSPSAWPWLTPALV